MKALRSHTDDGEGSLIEAHRAADHRGIAGQRRAPERMGEHDFGSRGRLPVVVPDEESAARGQDLQGSKDVAAHQGCPDAHRLRPDKRRHDVRLGKQVCDGGRPLPQPLEFVEGERRMMPAVHPDHLA